jgi:hypothetical protein
LDSFLNPLRSWECVRKTLPNNLNCPIDDVAKHSTKRATLIKNQKQPMGMPPTRPLLPKEKEVYELNINEDFS